MGKIDRGTIIFLTFILVIALCGYMARVHAVSLLTRLAKWRNRPGQGLNDYARQEDPRDCMIATSWRDFFRICPQSPVRRLPDQTVSQQYASRAGGASLTWPANVSAGSNNSLAGLLPNPGEDYEMRPVPPIPSPNVNRKVSEIGTQVMLSSPSVRLSSMCPGACGSVVRKAQSRHSKVQAEYAIHATKDRERR